MEHAFSVANLRCELLEEPRGIHSQRPRFSWVLFHPDRAQFQSAYQILVASSLAALEADRAEMWNSGRAESDTSVNVEYAGRELSSGGIYYWKVRTWDNAGTASPYSDAATFQMGLLRPEDWGADWIGAPEELAGCQPLLRNHFVVDKAVASATAFISGLGYYELRLNGRKVGDHVLDPGWTDYDKRLLYVTYDVRTYLRPGSNAIGVMLGNGWYCTPRWNGRPKMLLRLQIDFVDGTSAQVVSSGNSGWQVLPGPITANSIYDGETYDARLEQPGWDLPADAGDAAEAPGPDGCGPPSWLDALKVEAPAGVLTPQLMEPIKVIEELRPVAVTNPKPGVYVYDIGQNMAGWARLRVAGPRGTSVTMRFAETVYDDGTVNQENLRAAKCIDTYILAGPSPESAAHYTAAHQDPSSSAPLGPLETYAPRFTYHGFRFVQVEGFPGVPDADSITGCVVRSAVDQIGSFECGNPLLNQLHRNIVWTEAGNLHSLPTDCPQRDERMGWLNDMTVRTEEALHNFGMGTFYAKWENDIEDTQDVATGAIADTAPFLWGNRPADPVCSCFLLLPWFLYLHFGDQEVLKQHYPAMKLWVKCLESKMENGLVGYSHWGDWASPMAYCVPQGTGGAVSAITPGKLMSTGFLYYDAVLISRMARALGYAGDEEEYAALAARIGQNFNDAFYDGETGNYASGSQGANTFALFLGLVPEAGRAAVLDNLVRDVVETHQTHLTTGNICTKFIMEVLTDAGHIDVAYAIATQTTYPSWGYMIAQGATTVWERWEYATGGAMNSHSHPMYATVGSWFYKALAGINTDVRGPGFRRMTVKPHFPRALDQVSASLKTVRGLVKSSWERADALELTVSIPGNSEAEVWVPGTLAPVSVYESGELLCPNADLRLLSVRSEGEYLIFGIGSGDYKFVGRPGSGARSGADPTGGARANGDN